MFARCQQRLAKTIHRWNTCSASDEHRSITAHGYIESITQRHKYIQDTSLFVPAHGFRPSAYCLVDYRDPVTIPVTDRYGPSQEKSVKFDIYELTGIFYDIAASVGHSLKYHLVSACCDLPVTGHFVFKLFHIPSCRQNTLQYICLLPSSLRMVCSCLL